MNRFLSTPHVQYAYEDNFPRDQADEDFKEWRGKASAFVGMLAAKTKPQKTCYSTRSGHVDEKDS